MSNLGLTPIFKEYCSYLSTYKDKYGDDTIILMQVGSFFECYGAFFLLPLPTDDWGGFFSCREDD